MSRVPEIDPKSKDMGAAEGAKGGGDENPQDYKLPGGPGAPDAPADPAPKRRCLFDQITAMKKKPYQKVSQDEIPIPELPKEKSGLPSSSKSGEGTAETSFIEGEPSGRGLTAKDMATLEVEKDFPNMDHSKAEVRYRDTGTGAIIKVKMRNKTKWYPLYTHKKEAKPKKLSTKNFQKKSKRLSTLL